MHPVPTSRLAYGLTARSSESSFPERHAEPDDVAHLHDHDTTYDHQQHPHPPYHEPGFPKLGLLAPGLSAFWQQSWLEQHHPPPHHGAPSRQPRQQHHEQNHHWIDDPACFSPTSPHGVRIPSPQSQAGHVVFSSSPLPGAAVGDASAQAEWDSILRAANDMPTIEFPWLPTQAGGKVKSEDDSDSNWSVNDNSSDDLPMPQRQQPAPRLAPRRRLGSVPRVTKLSKVPAPGQGVYHTFRMSKRPPAPAAPDRPADFSEATPFGPIASYDPANGAQNEPAKMLEKRIAHKLSEKSRRNRLTSAIREIQKLMPLDVDSEERAATTHKGDAAAVPAVYPHFSKVDVVEMAIGYIKRLQRENEEMAQRVKRAEEQSRSGSEESTGESQVSLD